MSQVWVNFTFAFGEIRVDFHICCFSGAAEVPVARFGEEDISTEAETKRQKISRSARMTRRLVSLARCASVPIDFSSQNRSRTLLEQAFDVGINQLESG